MMKLIILQGERLCWECHDQDTKNPEWRTGIIGVVIGSKEVGIPAGLRLALCPRHFKKLMRMKPKKQKRIIKRRKR
jgi:hypothetical protein